jgi:alpha-1,2-mannosyltransferase
VALGLASAYSEALLVFQTALQINTQTGFFVFIFLVLSPGMFIAGTSYLPSSFAMYCITAAFAIGLSRSSFTKIFKIIFLVGLASLLGWPFAGFLAFLFAVDLLLKAYQPLTVLGWMIKLGTAVLFGILVRK